MLSPILAILRRICTLGYAPGCELSSRRVAVTVGGARLWHAAGWRGRERCPRCRRNASSSTTSGDQSRRRHPLCRRRLMGPHTSPADDHPCITPRRRTHLRRSRHLQRFRPTLVTATRRKGGLGHRRGTARRSAPVLILSCAIFRYSYLVHRPPFLCICRDCFAYFCAIHFSNFCSKCTTIYAVHKSVTNFFYNAPTVLFVTVSP